MNLFQEIKREGHEQVFVCADADSGLEAIIAIHSTRRGPALGGCRMWPYPDFDAALSDVLRLSKAMTYKAAVSELPLGGGKSVIRADPRTEKSRALLEAFARQVEALGGRYIVAEDIGMGLSDMSVLKKTTCHVAGCPIEDGGSGDPSPATAYGVFCGMRACLEEIDGNPSFSGKTVAIQGMGKVGGALAKLLHEAGAKLYISDMDPEKVAHGCRDFGADPIHGHEIYRVDCDIFSPCALGGSINLRTLPALSCRIVAGAANNQLESPEMAQALEERKILYAPDFVLNAGGIINIAEERRGYDAKRAYKALEGIYGRMKAVFSLAKHEAITSAQAALRLAERGLQKVRHA